MSEEKYFTDWKRQSLSVNAWLAWKARAELAAERERELEHTGWQQRYLCPDEGPSMWSFCSDKDAEVLARRDDYEVRKVYALVAHEELEVNNE